jgi:hypothetical protein
MADWWRSLALPEREISALLAESDAQQLRVALVAARVQCERMRGAVLRMTQEQAKVCGWQRENDSVLIVFFRVNLGCE